MSRHLWFVWWAFLAILAAVMLFKAPDKVILSVGGDRFLNVVFLLFFSFRAWFSWTGRDIEDRSVFVLLIGLSLSSCVEFKAASNATYKGPPWGKVAYSKGDEFFTSDHDAGWVATVTGIQNTVGGIAAASITGNVTKAVTGSNNALTATQGGVQKAAIAAKPTIVTPPATAVFSPAVH